MGRKRTILFLSRWFPFPTNNGSKLRIYNLLRGLAYNYDITLLSFQDSEVTGIYPDEIRAICRDVQAFQLRPFHPKSLRAQLGFFSLTPRSILDTYSTEMGHRIREVLSTAPPDIIIASQLGTAIYQRHFSGRPALFEEVENGVIYENYSNSSSTSGRFRNGLTWWKHRRYLSNLLHRFQACTVVSEKEKELLLRIAPGHSGVEVIPNCIDLNDYRDIVANPQPNALIFTGSFNFSPNYEAMVWFLEKVFPHIKAKFPDLKLTITGDHANRPLPGADDITLTGYVKDVRPLVASSWIGIVPILSGGGTRLKILEAMALHTPVVTTPKGAEGLNVKHESNILIGDTPEQFTMNIIKLLQDSELRQRLVTNAYQLIQTNYEWTVVMPRFINLVEKTMEKKTRS